MLIGESAPDAWINVHDILHFLPSTPGSISFIWASEETGHLHLYHVTCALPVDRASCELLMFMYSTVGESSQL